MMTVKAEVMEDKTANKHDATTGSDEDEDQERQIPRTLRTRQTRVRLARDKDSDESESSETEDGARKYLLRKREPKGASKNSRFSKLQ